MAGCPIGKYPRWSVQCVMLALPPGLAITHTVKVGASSNPTIPHEQETIPISLFIPFGLWAAVSSIGQCSIECARDQNQPCLTFTREYHETQKPIYCSIHLLLMASFVRVPCQFAQYTCFWDAKKPSLPCPLTAPPKVPLDALCRWFQ